MREIKTNYSGESIVKHDNSFIQAMFNFLKSFVGIGVISIASRVEHSGIILAIIWMIYSAMLSLVGTNLTVEARAKILKDDYKNEDYVGRRTLDSVNNQQLLQSEGLDHPRLSMDEAVSRGARSLSNTEHASYNTHELLMYNNYVRAYAEMGQRWYGDNGYYFCTFILLLCQIVVVTAYMRFYDEYFKAYAMLGALIPLWMFLDLKSISFFSTIAIVIILSSLLMILGIAISDISENEYDDLKYLEFFEFPLFFGSSIFMFEGDTVAMNIQDSMKNPKHFKYITMIGLGIITMFCWVLWIVPYYAYGNDISDPIINSVSVRGVRDYIKTVYTIAIGFGCPLMVYPICEIFYRAEIADSYIPLFKRYPMIKFYLAAIGALLFCFCFSKIIPGIGSFINISGAVLGPISTIIIPVAFYHKAFEGTMPWYQKYFHYLIWAVTSIFGALSFVATIIDEADD